MQVVRTANEWVLHVPRSASTCADLLERGLADVRGAALPASLQAAGVRWLKLRRAAGGDRTRYRLLLEGWQMRFGANLGFSCTVQIAPGADTVGASCLVRVRVAVGDWTYRWLPVPPVIAAVVALAYREWVGLVFAVLFGAGGWLVAGTQEEAWADRYGPGIVEALQHALEPEASLAAT